MGTVAFWAPDIIPPDEWLIPAVLYQDRIATMAPMASLTDRDGQQTIQMEDVLGDLWERVYFQPKELHLDAFLEARLQWWVQLGSLQAKQAADPFTRQWLDRVRGWPDDRRRRLRSALADAERDLDQTRTLARSVRESDEAQANLDARRQAVNEELATLRPVLRTEKDERARALASLRAQAELLRRGAWGVDPEADRALDRLHEEMRAAVAALVEHPSPERQRYLALRRQLDDFNEEDRSLRKQRVNPYQAARAINAAEERVRRCRDRLDEPWINDLPPVPSLVHGDTSVPDGLDTIGWGKIWGDEAFRFLATKGGMWSLNHPKDRWAHSLIAPTWIVEDLLVALAELQAASKPNWALAGRVSQLTDRIVGPREPAVAIGFSLPSPASGTVADAVRFRSDHADELESLRRAIEADLGAADAAELHDATANLRLLIAEPVAEVMRALELDKKLGCRAVGLTTLREIPAGLRALAAGSLATLLAAPIVGEPLTGPGVVGAAIGGAALVGARLGASTAVAARERWRIERRVRTGPYRYLYDVGRRFGDFE